MLFAVTFPAFLVPAHFSSFEEAPRDASNPKSLAYDVASVKVHRQESGGSMGSSYSPDGFSCNDLTLENLIVIAYGVNEQTISGGPRWIDDTGFDIQAKISEDEIDKFKALQNRERDVLLRTILADRFKLKVHYATKYQQLYELRVDKGGSKLKKLESSKSSGREMTMYSSGRYKGNSVTMKMLSDILAFILHSNIADGTNLDDAYEVDLRWKPDTESDQGSEDDVVALPSIFTALREQLGLKLFSTKGPVQKLVIDYAELPSAN
jgi:uncharacterized protein (TIGR03435 family)